MAGQGKLCFAFLLVFHVSLVSCHPDYYQYYSPYVKGKSSPESTPSSETGISTSASTDISIPVLYPENVISPKDNSYSSSNNDAYERYPSKPVHSAYTSHNDDNTGTILMIRMGLIIGCIVAVGLIICCIAICCPRRFKGKKRQGYIISPNIPEQPTANLVQPHIPQAVMQHFPPETQNPQHPPYETQQQFQYPSSEPFLHQNPMGQQQNPLQPMGLQQPLLPYGYSNPEGVPPPYPTKD